jgi:hypothetical protein
MPCGLRVLKSSRFVLLAPSPVADATSCASVNVSAFSVLTPLWRGVAACLQGAGSRCCSAQGCVFASAGFCLNLQSGPDSAQPLGLAAAIVAHRAGRVWVLQSYPMAQLVLGGSTSCSIGIGNGAGKLSVVDAVSFRSTSMGLQGTRRSSVWARGYRGDCTVAGCQVAVSTAN